MFMPFIQAQEVKLHYIEHGAGNNIVIFIHGYLGCGEWMNLILPQLPEDIHMYAIDWRGCGDSEKPAVAGDFENYSLKQHAKDLINAIKALSIGKCSLATHSTGGLISTHMLLAEPKLFEKVLALDPVSPRGLQIPGDFRAFFQVLKEKRNFAFKTMAFVAPTLFIRESLKPGEKAEFKSEITEQQRALFNLIVDRARIVSDGAGVGTPFHLQKERDTGTLAKEAQRIKHHHLVLWGEDDMLISNNDMEDMVQLLPNCKLQIIKDAGHALMLENPDLYARIFVEYFS
jgi:pimeloyl-ACP methyl ester carboxylesterase